MLLYIVTCIADMPWNGWPGCDCEKFVSNNNNNNNKRTRRKRPEIFRANKPPLDPSRKVCV